MYLFKGLGQNIIPLSKEQIDTIHRERIQKIVDLGLKGIRGEEVFDEGEVGVARLREEEEEDKKEIMENVVEDLIDHGDMDE